MDIVDGASISGSAVSGRGSKAASGGPLSLNEFERAMGQLFPLAIEDGRPSARRAFNDSELQRISRLLELSGKSTWALRPRTYAVLRFISRLDAMDSFIAEGLCDISFPYSEKTLPEVIHSQASRSKFLEFQPLVLLTQVQAADVENDLGRHRHFAQDGNVFYQPIRSLGTGGFGEVDHVWSRLSLNEFARKRIPRGKTFKKDKAAILDFEKELSALKRLSHHHLIKFVGSYTDPKYVGLIMSPVADSNLSEFLRTTPFPTNQRAHLRRFYGCLGSAVLYLHHQKIRHKDIKPSNILVHGENVLLTDFGTSLDWTNKGESTTASRPSAISVPYCSPEVMDWEPRNSSSDVYSLGFVFLDITTVLKGESLDNMRLYFNCHGSNGSYVRSNPEALHSWLKLLYGQMQQNPEYAEGPPRWIQNMVQINPRDRPSAVMLTNDICEWGGEFCGTCCLDDDDNNDSSYQGSISNDDNTQDLNAIDIIQRQRGRAGEAKARATEDTNSTDIGISHLALYDRTISGSTPIPLMQVSKQNVHVVNGLRKRKRSTQALSPRKRWTRNRPFNNALHNAAERGDMETMKQLLSEGSDSTVLDDDLDTPLHLAAQHGHAKVVQLLLENWPNTLLLERNTDHDTPLHLAAWSGHENVCLLLLEKCTDPQRMLFAKNNESDIPLHFAAEYGHEKVVQLLLATCADTQKLLCAGNKEGDTALRLAIRKGNENTARLLLEKCQDKQKLLETCDKEYNTPFHTASWYGRGEILRYMLDISLDTQRILSAVNKDGHTALHYAAEAGQFSAVILLLEKGACIDATDRDGDTSLHLVSYSGYESTASFLLSQGANVLAKGRDQDTPLHISVWYARLSLTRLLLQSGADVAMTNKYQKTPLHLAAQNGDAAATELLLENGAETSVLDEAGHTPLHLAAFNGSETVANLLLARGADTAVRKANQNMALHLASLRGHKAVAKLLVTKGADITSQGRGGCTPLHFAAKGGHGPLAELFLEHGADIDAINKNGDTPLHLAAANNNVAVVRTLLAKGANTAAVNESFSTPLELAVRKRRQKVVRLLCEKENGS